MTWQLVVWTVLAHVAVVVTVFAIVYGLPSVARSAYRYRLWSIRDDLWDDVHRGELRGREDGQRLLQSVEARINSVHDWSAVRLLSVAYAMSRHAPEQMLRRQGQDDGHTSSDPRVADYERRVDDLTVRYLRFATGVGWFRRPVVLALSRMGVELTPRSSRDVQAAGASIDREYRALAARLEAALQGPSDQPASGHV
ncbi:MAG TPA: hypothetical protein VGA69_06010 [Nitriliruptorales bacterium]